MKFLLNMWRRPSPSMLAVAESGEVLLARVRLVVILLLMIIPSWKLLTGSDASISNFVIYGALGFALAVFWYLKRFGYTPIVGFTTAFFDLSFVTLGLLLDVIARDTPLAAVNNRGTFDLYFLTIVAASLRYDRRICLFAGGMVMSQYFGFVWVAATTADINIAAGEWVNRYGSFFMPDQVSRMIFLLMATGLSYVFVSRSSRLMEQAIRDPLTGLPNREFMFEQLRINIAQANRERDPLTVVMIDLDHFKRINDEYGHPIGDAVLMKFAAFLQATVRDVDLVARYGGEEFTLVLANTHFTGTVTLLEKLADRLVQEGIVIPGVEKPFQITFSAGVAAFREDGAGAKSLIIAADRRLLGAKKAGRNRIVTADPK